MKTIGIFIVALVIVVGESEAVAGWWDKGVSIFQSLGTESSLGEPSLGDINGAFKQALRIGSSNVVGQLGAVDGFNTDSAVHIPLPEKLRTVQSVLATVGMSGMVDDLELRLNRAAEVATPKAKALFLDAITAMTFSDVMAIYKGPDDSATRYFQEKMSVSLADEMRPIVETSLSEVGAVRAYDSVMGSYQHIPFVPDVKADLTSHVVHKGMEGIFYYLAKEEAAIRKDPVRHTSALLKKVFGAR